MSKYRNIKGIYADDKTLSVLTKSKMKPESIIDNEAKTFLIFYEDGKRKDIIDKLIEAKKISEFESWSVYKSKEQKEKDDKDKEDIKKKKKAEAKIEKQKDDEENEKKLLELVKQYMTMDDEEKHNLMVHLTIKKTDKIFKDLVRLQSLKNQKDSALDEFKNIKWYPKQLQILEILKTKPDARKIYINSDDGNTGKSFLCKYIALKYQGVVIADGKKDNIFHEVNKLCSNGIVPKIIILDVPRQNENYVQYGVLEQLKNGLLVSGKYEGGQCIFPNPHVIIFCNFELDVTLWTADRPVFITDTETDKEILKLSYQKKINELTEKLNSLN